MLKLQMPSSEKEDLWAKQVEVETEAIVLDPVTEKDVEMKDEEWTIEAEIVDANNQEDEMKGKEEEDVKNEANLHHQIIAEILDPFKKNLWMNLEILCPKIWLCLIKKEMLFMIQTDWVVILWSHQKEKLEAIMVENRIIQETVLHVVVIFESPLLHEHVNLDLLHDQAVQPVNPLQFGADQHVGHLFPADHREKVVMIGRADSHLIEKKFPDKEKKQ